ncbi:hypothetical protein QWZ10_24475 [Paracoccus cavernae]|uniref:Uncharacterized protein n=1 Tax=Paracoccus cavernae TaxID=1571207 RepID=A0ABT8DEJ3_9RHOB|nr:hypothetical protein [Paracoccus cavernae]
MKSTLLALPLSLLAGLTHAEGFNLDALIEAAKSEPRPRSMPSPARSSIPPMPSARNTG